MSTTMRLSRELGEEERPSGETRGGPRLVLVRPSLVAPTAERRPVDPRLPDELWAELAALYPDPVDVFEDALAERLGLRRHPGCDLEGWRRARVQAIDALENDDTVSDIVIRTNGTTLEVTALEGGEPFEVTSCQPACPP